MYEVLLMLLAACERGSWVYRVDTYANVGAWGTESETF